MIEGAVVSVIVVVALFYTVRKLGSSRSEDGACSGCDAKKRPN